MDYIEELSIMYQEMNSELDKIAKKSPEPLTRFEVLNFFIGSSVFDTYLNRSAEIANGLRCEGINIQDLIAEKNPKALNLREPYE